MDGLDKAILKFVGFTLFTGIIFLFVGLLAFIVYACLFAIGLEISFWFCFSCVAFLIVCAQAHKALSKDKPS